MAIWLLSQFGFRDNSWKCLYESKVGSQFPLILVVMVTEVVVLPGNAEVQEEKQNVKRELLLNNL